MCDKNLLYVEVIDCDKYCGCKLNCVFVLIYDNICFVFVSFIRECKFCVEFWGRKNEDSIYKF